jgi:hypothetical protein
MTEALPARTAWFSVEANPESKGLSEIWMTVAQGFSGRSNAISVFRWLAMG